MSSTATATTTTTTAKLKDRSSSSSASQKFWPLKKFNLHGKTAADEQQQSIALSQTNTVKASSPITAIGADGPAAKDTFSVSAAASTAIEKDAQKKSKNKRLSSLLSSSRRQQGSTQPPPAESMPTTAENTTKKQQNASNTPTLTRKTGREISNKTRAAAVLTVQNNTAASAAKQQNNLMAPKSAGSGTLGRSTAKRTKDLRNGSIRRASEDKLFSKRSQSPPAAAAKRNDSPTHQQPNIMLESVQQRIQLEQQQQSNSSNKDNNNSAIKKDNNQFYNEIEKAAVKDEIIDISAKYDINCPPKSTAQVELDDETNKLDTKEKETYQGEEVEEKEEKNIVDQKKKKDNSGNSSDDPTNNRELPLPSPPVTPTAVATSLPELSATRDEPYVEASEASNAVAGIINIHGEPVSPTMCTFNVQQQNGNINEIEKLQQQLFAQQQPIPRSIHRLRSAASFATLRQLASTNNTLQNQQLPQQQYQQQQIQHIKIRPVSFIESSSHNGNINYLNYASSLPNDDHLTVVDRPTYYRRASSEDSNHFHVRQQSDYNSNSIQFVNNNIIGSRRLVRSNTVHNLIIKDGQGHRIVQCVGGLDQSPPLQPLRKKSSSFESSSNESSFRHHDSSPPPEILLDDILYRQQQQQTEEQQYHQQQYLLIQQQQQNYLAAAAAATATAAATAAAIQHQQQDNRTDASSDSSGSSSGGNRRITRKDSAKSISSLCSSTSPPTSSYDSSRFEKLKNKLEKERAIVKALQKQKEACNKDVVFLNKNVNDLTSENLEWKKKYESEKTLRERYQDDLSSALDKFNEATEQIRQLENQNKALKSEIDDKIVEIRELEKKKQQRGVVKSFTTEGKSTDRVLAAQLQHSQNQVRLLKSTMEQFLKMGVFNDDLNSSNSSCTSPTTSIEALLPDFKCNKSRQQQQQRRNNNPGNNKLSIASGISATTEDASSDNTTAASSAIATTTPPAAITRSRQSLVPTAENLENCAHKPTKTPEKNKQQDGLDIELLELAREKEILQAEYSKAPSSGGNALIRRRREELESRLDTVDSQMCRIKLKMRSRNIL